MRVAYDNLFDDYDLEWSGENGNYPAVNVQDSRLSKVWRTTSLTSHTITVDSGTGNTIQPTVAALLNTNFSTGATVKIQGSSSTSFPSTGSTESALTRVDNNYWGAFLSLSAKRHWRFLVKDTGSTDTYMSVGRAWLSTYITVSNSVQMEFQEEMLDSSEHSVSYSGQLYGDEGVIRRGYNVKFPSLNSTQKSEMETFLDTVKKVYPFITYFDSSNLTKLKPLYGFKPTNHRFQHIYQYLWSCDMRIEEVK